jgi:CRISPR-associated protein Csy1
VSAAEALQRARGAFARGDDPAALRDVDAAIAAGAGDEALALGVNAALRAGELARAIGWLERLRAAHPAQVQFGRMLATAHNNLGARHLAAGDVDGASAAFARALDAWPDHPEALFNRARLALEARQPRRALDDLARLRTLRPGDPAVALLATETELALGAADPLPRLRAAVGDAGLAALDPLRVALALSDGGDPEAALERALAVDAPQRALGAADVAWRLAGNAQAPHARRVFAHVAALCGQGREAPGLFAALGSRLSLPMAYAGAADLAEERASVERGLATLEHDFTPAAVARCRPLLEQLAWSNQMLAYQGHDDRALLRRYARWLAAAVAAMVPRLATPPRGGRGPRRRIGFISANLRRGTIGAYFESWVHAAAAAGHEVVVVQLPPAWDAFTDHLGRVAGRLLRPQGSLQSIAGEIRALDLDLALYPDLGVDGRVSVLAALRMAPRQAMAWGHPSTFGLDAVDAFIGCAAMEPPAAQDAYHERLLLLPGAGTAWQPPPPAGVVPRAALGLPEGRVYLLPQQPYKVHPDTDGALASIAANDPEARIVLFEGERPGATRVLRARLAGALAARGADPRRQLAFLPLVDRARFLATCAAADVMVDTHHWSGGNTTLDCLHAGLPVVSVAGSLMRGRQGMALLRALGLDELVVADGEAQARQAIAVAADGALRADLRRRIGAALPALLDGSAALGALRGHLDDLLAAAPRHA